MFCTVHAANVLFNFAGCGGAVEVLGKVMLLNNTPPNVYLNNNYFQNSRHQNMQHFPQQNNATTQM